MFFCVILKWLCYNGMYMDPSYNNSFGGFGAGQAGVGGGFNNGNFQQQMGLVQNDMISIGEPKKKSKLGIIIGILVGLVLIVGVVIWFVTQSNNKKRIKAEVDELGSLLSWVSYTDQCSLVTNNVEDIYADTDEFQTYINNCKKNAKSTKTIMGDLKNLDNSNEYVSLYDSLNSFVNKRMVFGEDLEEILKDFEAWHSFVLANSEVNYYQIDETVDEIVKPLIETGNEKMIQFANEWASKKKALNLAYMMMEDSEEESYKDDFDVSTVIACSEESGIQYANIIRDTKFKTTYTRSGMMTDEYICDEYALKASGALDEKTHVALICNTTSFTGKTYLYPGKRSVSICPVVGAAYPYDFRGVVQHEIGGHGIGKLGDERIDYYAFIQNFRGYYEQFIAAKSYGWYDNLSLTDDIKGVPWSHMIFDPDYSDVVDVYEGGFYFSRGVFRSESNSCMNNYVPYFSAISRESIVRRIMEYAGEPFSYESFKEKDQKSTNN